MRFLRHTLLMLTAALASPIYAAERLSVVATTGMIADAASEIGQDLVEVTALMGPGVDPHAYRQTRSDIVAMAQADLVLWNGLYLEAQMQDFLQDLSRKTDVVAVAEVIPADVLRAHDDYADKYDPHIWMDPALWSLAIGAVKDALVAALPEKKDVFEANEKAYQAELAAVSAYARESLSSVPAAARVLLSAHDAFGYFGAAYDFEVMGIQGISTESEAGLNRIGELVDMLVSRDVAAVFVETSVSDRSVRALIEGAAAEGHRVTIGGELFSDAMGAGGTYEGTYIGMIDHNATIITNALGGIAPEMGRLGRLSAGY